LRIAQSPLDPSPPACLDEAACRWLWDLTHRAWLAETGALILTPLRMLLIVAMALVTRVVLHRAINRVVRRTADGNRPSLLRPLPDKARTVLSPETTPPERRRQRAETLGSILKSSVSFSLFVMVALLLLGELGVNLAPLLASAGIAGIALGFGAQSLVRDLLAGLFILMENQFGVGDLVDLGEASGTVEAIGLRVTTLRDLRGTMWYVPNGEIRRVGNRSQGWAVVVVDMPIGFAPVTTAMEALRAGARRLVEEEGTGGDLLNEPEILGVDQVGVEGAVVRTTAKTKPAAQWRIGRQLRRLQAEELEAAGIADKILAARVYSAQAGSPGAQPMGGSSTKGGRI
jgi:small-conductance mechanosensitive channel